MLTKKEVMEMVYCNQEILTNTPGMVCDNCKFIDHACGLYSRVAKFYKVEASDILNMNDKEFADFMNKVDNFDCIEDLYVEEEEPVIDYTLLIDREVACKISKCCFNSLSERMHDCCSDCPYYNSKIDCTNISEVLERMGLVPEDILEMDNKKFSTLIHDAMTFYETYYEEPDYEEECDGPYGGAFRSWDDFYCWKEGYGASYYR